MRRIPLALAAIAAAVVVLAPGVAAAADCACDHTIDDSVYTLDGAQQGFGPGDRICFQAGTYGAKRFERLEGAPGDPIVITNCGGLVELPRLTIAESSKHVRLTGSGDPAHRYGFRFDASAYDMAVGISGYSTNVEVDHIEVTASGFAGIMAKTDAAPTSFEQHDTLIHDNYIHDVDGEGIYLGYSFYDETTAHRLIGTRVYDNIIVDTGWDGIQVGSADQDTRVYDNYIENAGTEANFVHGNGIQIGVGTTGEVYGNVIIETYAHSIINFAPGESLLYDNLLIESGRDGIWHSPRTLNRTSYLDSRAANINNTIILPAEDAIELHSVTGTAENFIVNNLMVSQNNFLNLHPSPPRHVENNLEFTDLAGPGFVDPLLWADLAAIDVHDRRQALRDGYALTAGSPARDTGVDVSGYGVPAQPGNAAGVYDVGAFLTIDATDPVDPDAGPDAGTDAGTVAGTDAGSDAGADAGMPDADAGVWTPDSGGGSDGGNNGDCGGSGGADVGVGARPDAAMADAGEEHGLDIHGEGGCAVAAGDGAGGGEPASLLLILGLALLLRRRR